MPGRALMILATLLLPLSARADGGLARLVVESGELRLTVFSSPTPLRAGPVDLSVMVQDRETLEPMLDRRVELRLVPSAGGRSLEVAAIRGHSTNRLLYSALVDLPDPGRWRVEVEVTGAREPGPEPRRRPVLLADEELSLLDLPDEHEHCVGPHIHRRSQVPDPDLGRGQRLRDRAAVRARELR